MWNFLTTSTVYKFKMRLPGQPPCHNEQECGLLIEVTGISRDNPEQFSIQIIVDKDKYPGNLHHHDVTADKLHLVMEEQINNTWYNQCISWYGRPVYLDNGSVRWGRSTYNTAWDQFPARLVVLEENSVGGEHGAQ